MAYKEWQSFVIMSCYNAITWITMACGPCAQLLLSNSGHPISCIPSFFPPTPPKWEAFLFIKVVGVEIKKDPSILEKNGNKQSTRPLSQMLHCYCFSCQNSGVFHFHSVWVQLTEMPNQGCLCCLLTVLKNHLNFDAQWA